MSPNRSALFVLISMVTLVVARLGDGSSSSVPQSSNVRPSNTSQAMADEPKKNVSFPSSMVNASSSLDAEMELSSWLSGLPSKIGYEYIATTTRYGNTCCSSCGNVNTAALVEGTDYYAVASAEAMQGAFEKPDWCGSDGSGHGNTAAMGCMSCAKGRFIDKNPLGYPLWADPDDSIFATEINIVVADLCPHSGNERWCPSKAGTKNEFGSENHFDFADPPPKFDNYYFVFTKAACSGTMKARFAQMSTCGH